MGKTIDMMGAVELDALGAAHDTPRHISGVQVEPDSYYRERLRVVLATNNTLQMPPMSLRDYFAAKAMQIAYDGHAPEYLAEVAYQMADAMLAERSEPSEQDGALISAEGGISIVHQKSHDAFERVRRLAERAE